MIEVRGWDWGEAHLGVMGCMLGSIALQGSLGYVELNA